MKRKIFVLIAWSMSTYFTYAQNTHAINLDKSQISWTGSNLLSLGSHEGIIRFQSGELHILEDSIQGGVFIADMTTIENTDGKYNEMLVDHLKNEDFFDVKKFPVSILTLSDVEYREGNQLFIRGNLTIKSITHPVELNAKWESRSNELSVDTLFFIDRSKWDIRYGSKSFFNNLGNNVISDAIKLEVMVVVEGG